MLPGNMDSRKAVLKTFCLGNYLNLNRAKIEHKPLFIAHKCDLAGHTASTIHCRLHSEVPSAIQFTLLINPPSTLVLFSFSPCIPVIGHLNEKSIKLGIRGACL